MKKFFLLGLLPTLARSCALVLVCALMLSSCASVKVDRVASNTTTDFSGYWNDTDVRIVAEGLINECLSSAAVTRFAATGKRLPVIIVGAFKNQSDEHIDTSILTKKFEAALINSGKAEFVASSSERGEVRTEREQQQLWANEATAKRLANEAGADFMLVGSVKTMVDSVGKKSARTYMVYAELIDIETNKKLWIGENADIKKIIKRSSVGF